MSTAAGTETGARACPLCGSLERQYMFSVHGLTYHSCPNCSLVDLSGPASADAPEAESVLVSDRYTGETTDTDIERAHAYWRQAAATFDLDPAMSRVLVMASNSRVIAETGREEGFRNVETVPAAFDRLVALPRAAFDAAIVVLAAEKMSDPPAGFRHIRRALKAGGGILAVMPMIDSRPAKLFGSAWTQLRPDNLFLFSTANAQSMLWDVGFNRLTIEPDRPRYSLHHVYSRARVFPRTWLTRLILSLLAMAPAGALKRVRVPVPSSAFVITARRKELRARKMLSIVMPVYNEAKTFRECFDRVHAKQIPGIDKEIIIVESNSTDGSRELVRQAGTAEGVRVIYQDRPRGKGNAVRAGLAATEGDVVLIQDADLEYDVEDYDSLVAPILGHRVSFVLGSRHLGTWKMREFNDQPVVAALFNFGHVIFRSLFNLLYGQSLKDPFTMYKVFRTDCLHGLKLECNRFDFDFEIAIKLIRKGYTPLEIPVNYHARSLNEGKKVSAARDPWTWLWALVKFRFVRQPAPFAKRKNSRTARADE